MSDRNKKILEKALVATTTGGQLTPEQSNAFLSTVVSQNALLSQISTQTFSASTYHMDIIGIAPRQMRAATEGTDPAFTGVVTIPRRSLINKETILPYDISINFIEENIAGGGVEAKLNADFATQFGNDIVDLGCIGNEGDADPFININDGWIDIAIADGSANGVDLASGTDYTVLLGLLLAGMPVKYLGMRDQLRFFCSYDFEESYRSELADRATVLGDAAITQYQAVYYHGIKLEPVPFWVTRNPMLTTLSNLYVGFGRNISVDREKKPRKRVYEYTITAKFDFNYAISDLIVIGNDDT